MADIPLTTHNYLVEWKWVNTFIEWFSHCQRMQMASCSNQKKWREWENDRLKPTISSKNHFFSPPLSSTSANFSPSFSLSPHSVSPSLYKSIPTLKGIKEDVQWGEQNHIIISITAIDYKHLQSIAIKSTHCSKIHIGNWYEWNATFLLVHIPGHKNWELGVMVVTQHLQTLTQYFWSETQVNTTWSYGASSIYFVRNDVDKNKNIEEEERLLFLSILPKRCGPLP